MEERNKVSVRICGQEYTIAGESSREHIMNVADYVDNKMQEFLTALPSSSKGDLAVLTALNVADEYFRFQKETQDMRNQNTQLRKDVEHFSQLWEDAKRTQLQYREQKAGDAADRKLWEEKCKELENSYFDLQMENIRLKGEIERYRKIIDEPNSLL